MAFLSRAAAFLLLLGASLDFAVSHVNDVTVDSSSIKLLHEHVEILHERKPLRVSSSTTASRGLQPANIFDPSSPPSSTPPPASDCPLDTAIPITLSSDGNSVLYSVTSETTAGATPTLPTFDDGCSTNKNSPTKWYSLRLSEEKTIAVTTCSSSTEFDTVITLFRGGDSDCGAICEGSNDNHGLTESELCAANEFHSMLVFTSLASDEIYYFAVSGSDMDKSGPFQLIVAEFDPQPGTEPSQTPQPTTTSSLPGPAPSPMVQPPPDFCSVDDRALPADIVIVPIENLDQNVPYYVEVIDGTPDSVAYIRGCSDSQPAVYTFTSCEYHNLDIIDTAFAVYDADDESTIATSVAACNDDACGVFGLVSELTIALTSSDAFFFSASLYAGDGLVYYSYNVTGDISCLTEDSDDQPVEVPSSLPGGFRSCRPFPEGGFGCLLTGGPLMELDPTDSGSMLEMGCYDLNAYEIEPTPENCICYIDIRPEGHDGGAWPSCSHCEFLSNDPTDGEWEITYDCSNIGVKSRCITKEADGTCINNFPQPPPRPEGNHDRDFPITAAIAEDMESDVNEAPSWLYWVILVFYFALPGLAIALFVYQKEARRKKALQKSQDSDLV